MSRLIVQKYGGSSLADAERIRHVAGRIARDRREELSAKIRGGLEQGADLFLTSGGVSVGDFDMVKEVLAAEGEVHFWWVSMKPGKPLACGQIGGVPLLGLPAAWVIRCRRG